MNILLRLKQLYNYNIYYNFIFMNEYGNNNIDIFKNLFFIIKIVNADKQTKTVYYKWYGIILLIKIFNNKITK